MPSSLISSGDNVSGFPFTGAIYAKEVEKKDGAKCSYKDGRSCMIALVMDLLCVILPIIFIFTVSLDTGPCFELSSLSLGNASLIIQKERSLLRCSELSNTL